MSQILPMTNRMHSSTSAENLWRGQANSDYFPHRPNQGQQYQVHPSIDVQPQNHDTPQSNPTRFPRWVPQSISQRSNAIPQPDSSHRKRPHEAAPSGYSKHNNTATATATFRHTRSYYCARHPNCGRRQLDGRYICAIVPRRTARTWSFDHHRGQ